MGGGTPVPPPKPTPFTRTPTLRVALRGAPLDTGLRDQNFARPIVTTAIVAGATGVSSSSDGGSIPMDRTLPTPPASPAPPPPPPPPPPRSPTAPATPRPP